MTNIKKFNQLQPAGRARLVSATKTSLYLLPFGLIGGANAQELEALTTKATGGVGGIVAAVATIAGVALAIGLIVWGVGKLKPRG
jgi:hypothetical protein